MVETIKPSLEAKEKQKPKIRNVPLGTSIFSGPLGSPVTMQLGSLAAPIKVRILLENRNGGYSALVAPYKLTPDQEGKIGFSINESFWVHKSKAGQGWVGSPNNVKLH